VLVATLNVRSNPEMVQRRVVHDVRRAVAIAAVVLWQEIGPTRYKNALRALAGLWRHAHLRLAIPISWDAEEFERLGSGHQRTHRGRATASPARYLSWVILRHRETGAEVVFLNTHFVSGAWNDKRKTFKAWRRRMWLRHYAALEAKVAQFHDQGYTVVGGGDFNRRNVERFHADLEWMSAGGIDYLFVVPGPHDKTNVQGFQVVRNFESDHNARVAALDITPVPTPEEPPMMYSQNGWKVLEASTATRNWVIPGSRRTLRLHPGHAGFVLVHLALWFHEVVERLDNAVWDDWGWALRAIRGQTRGYSNHASGTAMDLNATKHPLGVRGSFTAAWQYARIRARLVWYAAVIRWGGDYQYRADEMHFEIDKGARAVERLARRLARTPRGRRIIKANPDYRPAR
jgi:hypothetical protein